MAFYRHVRAATNGFKTNDVIRLATLASPRRSLAVIGRAAYTVYSIYGITAILYFAMIKHNATKVSADALYSVRKFSFCKVYTAFVGNLFCRSHVLFVGKLQKLRNFDTQSADIRRTCRLCTNLGELT